MEFGRFIKPIEHPLFNSIDQVFNSKTVMKGLNYCQVGQEIERKWNRFVDPRSIDGDVSRLDSSISDEGIRTYHKFARRFIEDFDHETFDRLCELQFNRTAKGKSQNGNVSFKTSGLGSGQMNTSQTGVFIVCLILHFFIKHNDIDVEVVNCGDDFTIIGEEYDVRVFKRRAKTHFSLFNMVLKLGDIRDEIESIEFCQTSPVMVDGKYRMVRNPFNALPKDAASIDQLNTVRQRADHLHAVSSCGIATHGDIPIFNEFYSSLARNAISHRKHLTNRQLRRSFKSVATREHNSMVYWGKGLNSKYLSDIPFETRFSFFKAFNIDPIQQVLIETVHRDFKLSHELQDIVNSSVDYYPW